ncbi:Aldo-ket-red domain-containing protein [Mycena chlorophos]|uniref:Aldo-ket-red domain-containing protein n=1 Tax=Mycena chlorophos TaxID=658473 RepID=A0A8H6SV76_MYCCL|nr:Aldo-ket-red domain-containing protein [Mycena chlorophos]
MLLMAFPVIYGTAWREGEQDSRTSCCCSLERFPRNRHSLPTKTLSRRSRRRSTPDSSKPTRNKTRRPLPANKVRTAALQLPDSQLRSGTPQSAGTPPPNPSPTTPPTSITTQITTSFAKSLSNLHTTYLDSYILHSPLPTLEQTIEAWEALCALQDTGKARQIGVSNTYDVQILEALAAIRPVQVVQNRWYERASWDRDVCRYCKEHGIQYQSFWTLSGSPKLLSSPDLTAVAQNAGCTAPQALFKFAMLGGVTPLCGTTNETHMSEVVAASSLDLPASTQLDNLSKLIWG